MKNIEATRPQRGQEIATAKPVRRGAAYVYDPATSMGGATDKKNNRFGPIFLGDVPPGVFDDVSHENDD